jgi:hypothetical protein
MILYRALTQKAQKHYAGRYDENYPTFLSRNPVVSYGYAAAGGGDRIYKTDIYIYKKDIPDNLISFKDNAYSEEKNKFFVGDHGGGDEAIYTGSLDLTTWEYAHTYNYLTDYTEEEYIDEDSDGDLFKYKKLFDSLSDNQKIKIYELATLSKYRDQEGLLFYFFYIFNKVKNLNWHKPKIEENILSFNNILKLNTKYL